MGEEYEKLVRDKVPQILDQKGLSYERRVATPEEYKIELIKKLGEEVKEFSEQGDVEELADVLEVVEALRMLPEYQHVGELQEKKREERGGFDGRLIVKGKKG